MCFRCGFYSFFNSAEIRKKSALFCSRILALPRESSALCARLFSFPNYHNYMHMLFGVRRKKTQNKTRKSRLEQFCGMQLISWLFAPQQQLPMKMKLIIMFVTLRFLCVRPFLASFFEPQLSHSFRSYFRFRFCVRFWEFQSCVWARSGLGFGECVLWQIGGLLVYDLIMAIRSASSSVKVFFCCLFSRSGLTVYHMVESAAVVPSDWWRHFHPLPRT